MKRSAPLKRTPFRSKPLRQHRQEGADMEREPKPWAVALVSVMLRPLHRGTYRGTVSGEAVGKECASQHHGYMAAVRDLGYCMRCRKACRPQFCHRDEGKGMAIKTDVREGWPGCEECHRLVGSSGFYPRDEKRALELEYGRRTREAVKAAGTWPKRLAMWD